jgi:hypothetical protein
MSRSVTTQKGLIIYSQQNNIFVNRRVHNNEKLSVKSRFSLIFLGRWARVSPDSKIKNDAVCFCATDIKLSAKLDAYLINFR